MFNEAFGWLWVSAGFATGMLLGLGFHGSDWLGGYASFRRRLLRLGHISLIMLGVLNILFAQSIEVGRIAEPWLSVASVALIIGGVAMPICCGLAAWRPALRLTFAVPVASLLTGGIITAIGVMPL